MRFFKTEAIVLRSFDFGETDRLVILYSKKYGKLRAVAKGVRKPHSKFGPALEAFSNNEVMLYKKENDEVYRITGFNAKSTYAKLIRDLDMYIASSYVVEIVNMMTEEHEPHRDIYKLLEDTLEMLPENDAETVILSFVLKFFSRSGYGLCLDRCVLCEVLPRRVNRQVRFSPGHGGIICQKCDGSGKGTISVPWEYIDCLRQLESRPFSELCSIKIQEAQKKAIKDMLDSYMRFHLSYELKTDRFARQLKHQGDL